MTILKDFISKYFKKLDRIDYFECSICKKNLKIDKLHTYNGVNHFK